MTVVKICGLRSLEDARAAAAAGADIVSFIFYPGSRRYISLAEAGPIIATLRAEREARPVICGLFVNAAAAAIAETADACGLDLVQLAGDEPLEVVTAMALPVLKTFRPEPGETASLLARRIARYGAAADRLPAHPLGVPFVALVDATVPGQYGGTGQRADWRLCADTCAHLPTDMPLMLAGGLTPENVGAAVRNVRPWGVDVASGVEARPGVKDAARMRAFVNTVRAADERGARNDA